MDIKLSFLGAAQNVTGSRFLLEVNGTKLLVDCGLYQERNLLERNWDPFPVPASQIDALLLTHAHLDHCGLIPKLVREGFSGPIYCTTATAEIAEIVLLDAGSLQEEDAAYKRKRHRKAGYTPPRPVVPLYTVEDARLCPPMFRGVAYKQVSEIFPGIKVSFHDAGHILGAAMLKVKIQLNGESRTILFSGDVGRWDRPILNDPTLFEEADYVLIESTYGDRVHEDVADIKGRLEEIVNTTAELGGNIIVPSFAIERSQEVLYFLHELLNEDRIDPLLVFLDSPMAISVTKVFQKHPEMLDREMNELLKNNDSPFDFAGLQMTRTTKQSQAINNIKGTIMVIAGSGMCTGGRVKHHLVTNIERPESTILFVGYQAVGTLGRHIVSGEKEVRILGQTRQVKARIARINGFSAHADKNELIRWLKAIKAKPKKVFVIHGETNSASAFKDLVTEELGLNAVVPAYNDVVQLD